MTRRRGSPRQYNGRRDDEHILHLESEVAGLKTEVAYIRRALDSTAEKIADLADTIQQIGRPQWQTYASWAGVLLLLVGAYGSGYISVLDRHTQQLDRLAEWLASHNESVGKLNAEQSARIGNVELRVQTVEEYTKELMDWQLRHAEVSATEHAAQNVRIEYLERGLRELEHAE